MHPERTTDPLTLLWRTGRCIDRDTDLGALTTLVARQVLAAFELGHAHVRTTLRPGRDWASEGVVVRDAVQQLLATEAARLVSLPPTGRDAIIARAAEHTIAEVVGPVATSHGGAVQVIGVHDAVVSVGLHGACHGCPAAALTLHGRLQHELRRRLPELAIRVVVAGLPRSPAGRPPRLIAAKLARRSGRDG